jgi:predicted porin
MRTILLATAAGFAALVATGTTPAHAQSATEVSGTTPAPGLTLTTSGRFRFHGAFISQDGDSANMGPATGSKLSQYDFNTYGRLRFDFDGVGANGLRYGGRLELRVAVDGGASPAAFFRVFNGFIGTPTLGQLRFGSNGVMAVPMMFTGHIMGTIGTGLLDGDVGDFFYTGQGGVIASSFWYSATGNVNRGTAIGYFTPAFAGFDAGISFAPNERGFLGQSNIAGQDIRTSDRISTVGSLAPFDANQMRNIFDAMVRYRGTFGGAAIALSGGLRTASTPGVTGAAVSFKNPTVGIIGGSVTFAGFTVGGISTFGSANRGFTPLPSTGNNDGMFSWQLGASYTIGALMVGAAYHELRSEGSAVQAADLRERGLGIGARYTLAPGLAVFAEYIWSRVRETGRDFDGGRVGTQDKFAAQAFMLGVGMGF